MQEKILLGYNSIFPVLENYPNRELKPFEQLCANTEIVQQPWKLKFDIWKTELS